jgi:hypothetical protein
MDQLDQSDQPNQFDPFSSPLLLSPSLSPLLSPPLPPLLPYTLDALTLPPLAIYQSKEALFEAIQSWSKPRGYAFTTSRSKRVDGRQKVYYSCDRCPLPRPLRNKGIRIRESQSRGTGCPFSILAIETPLLSWEIRYRQGVFSTHNHPPSQSPAAHPSHRHLTAIAQNTAQRLFEAGVPPRQSMNFIHNMVPETPLLPQDLYNFNASLRRDLRQGQSSTEALIRHLEEDGIKHCILKDQESLRLKGLFIAYPESIEYLQAHHDIILIDNTYSTNRFDMPLMDIIGKILVSGLNPSFQG